ncbi:MAG: hypothetical protein K0R33_3508 [Mycobacterium sp.]|nr:hypothetical protein [Mycobacterium sp.]
MTTLSVDPVLVWAITLLVCSTLTPALSLTVASPGLARSRAPSALVMASTGIFTVVLLPRVPPNSSTGRSSLSAMSNATAPRLAAMPALSPNWQVPRSTNTTDPCTGRPS